jgi:endonuclease G
MTGRLLKIVAGLMIGLCASTGASAGLPDFTAAAVPSILPQVQALRKLAAPPALPRVRAAQVEDEHLAMGNPSDAVTDVADETNYLMRKPEYDLSYNNATGTPNWVSWHLNASWVGAVKRSNTFRPDPDLPAQWVQVAPKDYANTGFDKGHMCNSGDRTRDAESNSQTFLMTNMVPQSPKNNEHTWEALERYSRELAAKGDELYIVSGPSGQGGEGKDGPLSTIPVSRGGKAGVIVVPAVTWKVILVLPSGVTSPDGVTEDARTIAVIMPNTQDIDLDWTKYIVTVADVERLTNFHFFSEVDPGVAAQLKQQKYQP